MIPQDLADAMGALGVRLEFENGEAEVKAPAANSEAAWVKYEQIEAAARAHGYCLRRARAGAADVTARLKQRE